MSRKFILVTATHAEEGVPVVTGSGIRKLKRGITMDAFIEEFIKPFETKDFSDRTIMLWFDAITVKVKENGAIKTWTFTEYPEAELLRAVSYLTKDELLRDLKELLPLKGLK